MMDAEWDQHMHTIVGEIEAARAAATVVRTAELTEGINRSMEQAIVEVYRKVCMLPPDDPTRVHRLEALTSLLGGDAQMLAALAAAEEAGT